MRRRCSALPTRSHSTHRRQRTPTTRSSRDLSRLETSYAGRVVAIAGRTFAASVDPAVLHRVAVEAVVELVRTGSRPTEFVPELALRAVREAVAGQGSSRGTQAADRLAA